MNKAFLFIALSGLLAFTAPAYATSWKAIYIAGDDSIDNFDNGREDISNMFSKLGKIQATHLSSSNKFISKANSVYPATFENIVVAFKNLNIQPDEGCLVHMTSHGAKAQGFYLSRSGIMPAEVLAKLVNQYCGKSPTVLLVSACYSGQFITESLKGPNRVILTAARADRPSFGCSADTRYTYWDHCLLDSTPVSKSWHELQKNIQTCIDKKERALGADSSYPQAFFGSNIQAWGLF